MDGRMNKDVKIGLAIGLLALIAIFCLVIWSPRSSKPPIDTDNTTGTGTETETEAGTETVQDEQTSEQPSHWPDHTSPSLPTTPRDDDTRAVISMKGREGDNTLVAADGYTPADDGASDGAGRAVNKETSDLLKAMEETTPKKDVKPKEDLTLVKLVIPRTHKVASGEMLGDISRKYYGTTRHYKKIMKANGITDARTLTVGKVLIIPDLAEEKVAPETVAPETVTDGKFHVVRKGETLSDISKKYYGTVKLHKFIMKANDISDADRILVGQRLRIPPKPVGISSGASIVEGAIKPGEQSYVVRSGDRLIGISMRFYGDARYHELIGKRNGITDPRTLRAGDAIIIPLLPDRSMLMETRAVD